MQDEVQIRGRVLYLSQQPELVRRQIAGEDISLQTAGLLRDDISTDEITPVTVMLTYDEKLGRYPYVGFESGGTRPIGIDQVKKGGFAVTVAGRRYGKGSSRESSPLAELYAGIKLIIAESFERIYQQNCDNIGILTSTDFSILEDIQNGRSIPIEKFLKGRDELTSEIVRKGGLMAYSKSVRWPLPGSTSRQQSAAGPLTLVEKIIRRNAHPDALNFDPGTGVFVAAKWRFSHDYFTGMSAYFMHRAFGNPVKLHDPDRIVAFYDHLVLASESLPHVRDGLLPGVANLIHGHDTFVNQYPVKAHGKLTGAPGAEGICHAMMTEKYVLPGEIVVGTDSHTPHSGSLGCLAFGAGATDMANSWVTGYARCRVPQTIRIEVNGRLQDGVTAKDIVLYLLMQEGVRKGNYIGCVFEFAGTAVEHMPVDERATLTNMVAELGGYTGIVAPDIKTVEFLRVRRGIEFEIEDWMRSDPGATYKDVIKIQGSAIESMVARPGDPGNGISIGQIEASIPIGIAYGGSCTAGKREDFDYYHEVLKWGMENGLKVAPNVKLFLQFGTLDVKEYCESRGYLNTFNALGVELVMPGCGSCANCGPGQSSSASDVTVSAINRNFPGRSGPGQVWLASPYTVAASALAGRIVSFAQLKHQG